MYQLGASNQLEPVLVKIYLTRSAGYVKHFAPFIDPQFSLDDRYWWCVDPVRLTTLECMCPCQEECHKEMEGMTEN